MSLKVTKEMESKPNLDVKLSAVDPEKSIAARLTELKNKRF